MSSVREFDLFMLCMIVLGGLLSVYALSGIEGVIALVGGVGLVALVVSLIIGIAPVDFETKANRLKAMSATPLPYREDMERLLFERGIALETNKTHLRLQLFLAQFPAHLERMETMRAWPYRTGFGEALNRAHGDLYQVKDRIEEIWFSSHPMPENQDCE